MSRDSEEAIVIESLETGQSDRVVHPDPLDYGAYKRGTLASQSHNGVS